MKHWLRGLMAVFMLLAVTGCAQKGGAGGNAPAASGKGALGEIIKRGEMRVGYLPWDPGVVKNAATGELTGIYPDMVDLIAKQLKVKVTWVETNLQTFTAGLAARQFDFCVGPSFITVPRAGEVAFTNPILFVGNSGAVKQDSPLHPKSIQELNDPKIRVAVSQGQAMEEYVKRYLDKADIKMFPGGDLNTPLQAVASGQADVGLSNNVTISRFLDSHPELRGVFMGQEQVEFLPIAWSTRYEDSALLTFLNASITVIKTTGRLEEFQKKYKVELLNDVPTLHAPR